MYPLQTLVCGYIIVALVVESLLTQRRGHGELTGIGAS